MELFGYLSAILMGITMGLIGGGGSILTVPILVYFFQYDGLLATTVSLFVVGTIALVGAVMNARRKLLDFKTGVLFAVPSFVGVFFARQILLPVIPPSMPLIDNFNITKSFLVLFSFAILMILASRGMIRSGKNQSLKKEHQKTHGFISIGVKGFLVGFTTGFVGAGGGFLIVPTLVLLLHLPMRKAVGTSLAIIAANSLFGFGISVGNYTVDWHLIAMITGLGIVGLFIGQRTSSSFPEKKLKQGFGYFVLVIGLLVMIDQIIKMKG